MVFVSYHEDKVKGFEEFVFNINLNICNNITLLLNTDDEQVELLVE